MAIALGLVVFALPLTTVIVDMSKVPETLAADDSTTIHTRCASPIWKIASVFARLPSPFVAICAPHRVQERNIQTSLQYFFLHSVVIVAMGLTCFNPSSEISLLVS